MIMLTFEVISKLGSKAQPAARFLHKLGPGFFKTKRKPYPFDPERFAALLGAKVPTQYFAGGREGEGGATGESLHSKNAVSHAETPVSERTLRPGTPEAEAFAEELRRHGVPVPRKTLSQRLRSLTHVPQASEYTSPKEMQDILAEERHKASTRPTETINPPSSSWHVESPTKGGFFSGFKGELSRLFQRRGAPSVAAAPTKTAIR